tara:strand:+ start:164 stop:364 length:201 start_codon:yes stop_codon:yes gene_type:complete
VVGLMVVVTNQQFKPLCNNVFFASGSAVGMGGRYYRRVSANSGGDNQVQGVKSWIEGIFTPYPAQG